MKHTVYIKMIIGYILVAVIGFFLVTAVVTPLIRRSVEETQGDYLYGRATLISKYYTRRGFTSLEDYQSIAEELTDGAAFNDVSLWIVTRNGQMCFDTSGMHIAGISIPNFDTSYFGNAHYKTGDFNGITMPGTLSTIAPVNSQFSTIGYVLLHMDRASIERACQPYYTVAYTAYLCLLAASLLLLLAFTVFVYLPLKKILTACKAYTDGDPDYGTIPVHSNDELGQLAGSLNYMTTQLRDLEDYQQKFIANISHDFRSPLTSIKGYLEAILDGTIPPEQYSKYLNVVLNETERLNKLTDDLLTANAWDTGGRKLIITEFDIVETIRNTLATFEGTCIKKKITVDLLLENKAEPVLADLEKIQRVLYNLIDNAIKFSNANSSVQISVTDKNEKVFVSVKDHGIGIPRESIYKIWDRFYKTDISRGKDKTGSGLGLSIAKEIIQSHNEKIDVISTEGIGTEFIFSLQKARN